MAKIYIADLAAYNNGVLRGVWLDLDEYDTKEEIDEAIAEFLAESTHGGEEWEIHDTDGLGDFNSHDFTELIAINAAIEEHGDWVVELVNEGYTSAENLDEYMSDNYQGNHSSLGSFAEDFYRDTGGDIPSALEPYIDWDAMGRAMEINGEIFSIEVGYSDVHIFWNN
jgi:antirestriction protein